jgi:hypothetical protein
VDSRLSTDEHVYCGHLTDRQTLQLRMMHYQPNFHNPLLQGMEFFGYCGKFGKSHPSKIGDDAKKHENLWTMKDVAYSNSSDAGRFDKLLHGSSVRIQSRIPSTQKDIDSR